MRAALDRMRRNKLLLLGSALGVLVLGAGILGPIISGADPTFQSFANTNKPPGTEGYLLGTDHLGRDLAVRLFVGIRVSLMVAAGVTLLSLILGLLLGMIGGFLGGWRDRTIRGVVDFVWGFPLILVAVLFAGGLGGGLFPVILAVGLVNTAAIAPRGARRGPGSERARVHRSGPGRRSVHRQDHGQAYLPQHPRTGAGFSPPTTWRWRSSPKQPCPSSASAPSPPPPSLGGMVSDGRDYLQLNHWQSTIPGLTIVLLVLAVSLIGDGLRDVFDPRLRHEAKGVEEE